MQFTRLAEQGGKRSAKDNLGQPLVGRANLNLHL